MTGERVSSCILFGKNGDEQYWASEVNGMELGRYSDYKSAQAALDGYLAERCDFIATNGGNSGYWVQK